jgi:DNA-binding IclR family transcriptional regulator
MTSRSVKKELAENSHKGLLPATRPELERLIAQTRKHGYARTSELIPGIAGMAAPVFDHSGAMVLALIALGYSKPFDAASSTIIECLLEAAAGLSRRLGFQPDDAR